MYICCLRNAYQRVVDFLLQNAEPVDDDSLQGVVALVTSKAVIASSLHLSAETFSRELHKLVDKEIIKIGRSFIRVLDIEKLRQECVNRELKLKAGRGRIIRI